MNAREVYDQSTGDVTKAYYAALLQRGPAGAVAMNLFRAHKASTRAKIYSRRFRGDAYQKKEWSLGLLVDALILHGAALGITFGWKVDHKTPLHGKDSSWLLYVDLPTGQCSFHVPSRGVGPTYPGEWDGLPLSDVRILRHCDIVMGEEPEDLKQLLKREKSENAQKNRRDALKAEIARLSGEEVQHVERQAQLVQAEMF